jgi:GT2 family glycosyltransferase
MESERATGQAHEAGLRSSPHVAIIILNWNGWRDTLECLESLNEVDYPCLDVLVVDNGSRDDSVVMISEWARGHVPVYVELLCNPESKPATVAYFPTKSGKGISRLFLIKLSDNVGFCAGNNIGMQWAIANGADYLLILNNDTIVTPGFLKPLIQAASTDSNVGLVGGVICYARDPQRIWFAGGRFDSFLETERILDGYDVECLETGLVVETDWVSGCMMMIPRQVYAQLGGFREDFFIWSEEWDYSLRVKMAGYRLVVATDARIFHKVGRSAGIMQPLSYYYGTRNRLFLKKLYLSWPRRTVFVVWFLLTRLPRYLSFGIQGRWDLVYSGYCAIRDYFLGRMGKWSCHVG